MYDAIKKNPKLYDKIMADPQLIDDAADALKAKLRPTRATDTNDPTAATAGAFVDQAAATAGAFVDPAVPSTDANLDTTALGSNLPINPPFDPLRTTSPLPIEEKKKEEPKVVKVNPEIANLFAKPEPPKPVAGVEAPPPKVKSEA